METFLCVEDVRRLASNTEPSRPLNSLYDMKDGLRRFQSLNPSAPYSEPYELPTNRAVRFSVKIGSQPVENNIWSTLEVDFPVRYLNSISGWIGRDTDNHGERKLSRDNKTDWSVSRPE